MHETFSDKDFTAKHTEYNNRLFFNPTPEGPNGELELRDLVKSDRAEFTMFVENIYGRANFTTLVRVRGKTDLNNQKSSGYHVLNSALLAAALVTSVNDWFVEISIGLLVVVQI